MQGSVSAPTHAMLGSIGIIGLDDEEDEHIWDRSSSSASLSSSSSSSSDASEEDEDEDSESSSLRARVKPSQVSECYARVRDEWKAGRPREQVERLLEILIENTEPSLDLAMRENTRAASSTPYICVTWVRSARRYIELQQNGVVERVKVERLLYEMFVDKLSPDKPPPQCERKRDECCNPLHMKVEGIGRKKRRKLSRWQAMGIAKLIEDDGFDMVPQNRDICDEFGISRHAAYDIKNGRSWVSLTQHKLSDEQIEANNRKRRYIDARKAEKRAQHKISILGGSIAETMYACMLPERKARMDDTLFYRLLKNCKRASNEPDACILYTNKAGRISLDGTRTIGVRRLIRPWFVTGFLGREHTPHCPRNSMCIHPKHLFDKDTRHAISEKPTQAVGAIARTSTKRCNDRDCTTSEERLRTSKFRNGLCNACYLRQRRKNARK